MPYINCKYCISLNIGYLHLYTPFAVFIMGEGRLTDQLEVWIKYQDAFLIPSEWFLYKTPL